MEPKMSVRGNPRPVKSTYDVDFAFGPEHDNQDVYSAVAGKESMDHNAVYRVTQKVSDLGWVDLEMRCSIILLGQ